MLLSVDFCLLASEIVVRLAFADIDQAKIISHSYPLYDFDRLPILAGTPASEREWTDHRNEEHADETWRDWTGYRDIWGVA